MCLWCVCVCVWCVAVCVLCVRPWVWRLSEGTRVSLSLGAGYLQVTSRWARGRAQPRAGPLQPLGPLALSPPACFCGASQGLVRRAGPAGRVGGRGDVQGRVLCCCCCTSSGVSAWGPGGRGRGGPRATACWACSGRQSWGHGGDSKQCSCLEQSQASFQETAPARPLPAGGAASHTTAGCRGNDPGQGQPLVAVRDETSC